MPLTSKQRAALEAKAKERGVDSAKLIAEAESISQDSATTGGKAAAPATDSGADASAEKPKLFMYLLPFVTVREVRGNWLGLNDSFPGDSSVASEWAAKHGAGGGEEPPE
jgi:hypothetical protein